VLTSRWFSAGTALYADQHGEVAPEYAIVMALLTVHALGGLYAFRAAASAMLTFEQSALYNYGVNAP
jgi:Flp pilus assembly pilin Flp